MRGPVLAVWGEMDPSVDAAVNAARYRLLFADAPDKRVMLVPDAGHVLLRAPQFNDQIASDWTLWKKLRFMLLGREAYVQPAVRDIADWIRQAAAGH